MANQPGAELVLQAVSGYTRYVGEPSGEPVRLGADIAGINSALFVYQAIVAGLIVDIDTPHGRFQIGGLPWRFSDTPCGLQPPTEPGQYTREYIRQTGRDPAEIPGATDASPKFVDIAAQISRPF